MMRIKLKVCLFLCIPIYSMGQLNKDQFILGGGGQYSTLESRSVDLSPSSGTDINVDLRTGYFLKDKFAAGITGIFLYSRQESIGTSPSSSSGFGLGPWARYYFLPKDIEINLFSEAFYLVRKGFKTKEASSNFGGRLGVIGFLNSSVGLEFSMGYQHSIKNYSPLDEKIFQYRLGFQIHY